MIRHIQAAFETKHTGSAKLVLLVLANFANENGEAWPSLETIGRLAGLGRRAVQKVLRALESSGSIQALTAKRGGAAKSTRYALRITANDDSPLPEKTTNERSQKGEPPFAKGRTTVRETANHRSPEALLSTKKHLMKHHTGSAGDVASEHFEAFWKAYPKKAARLAALKAWSKHKCDKQAVDILQGLERAMQSPQWIKDNGQFIPHAATWLNGQRWQDEAASTSNHMQTPQKASEWAW